MPTPKSVVKLSHSKKDGVEVKVQFTSEVNKAEYQMFELVRAALRDSCKLLKKAFQVNFNAHFKRRTGNGSNAVQYKVYSGKNTRKPAAEIGLPLSAPGKYVKGFYAFFQEVGSSKTPKLRLLFNAAQDNASKVKDIQAQYLEILNKSESEIENVIDENEMEAGPNENE